jgi:hypothetical protein
MNLESILALFDKEQRLEVQTKDMRREVDGSVIRQVSLTGGEGFIACAKLEPENADASIQKQIAYFESIEQNFEWKYYAYDQPDDLLERLRLHGFDIEEREALLSLELNHLSAKLQASATHAIRKLTNTRQLADVLTIENTVWDQDQADLVKRLANDMQTQPDMLSIYVAYVNTIPASAAWMYFHEGSQFASLWGGSTLEQHRGLGLYTALVAVRAQEAIRRGVKFLTVDASPMSQPILEKLGFQFLTYTYPCKWFTRR